MSKIDTIGTYQADIVEHTVGLSTGGFPQFVARFKATKKWVDDAESMKHFKLAEPAYVDWAKYNEDIVGYFVLFRDQQVFDENSAIPNYEQVQLALGWEGTDFADLAGDKYVNKGVLIRVGENEYEGKTKLQVNWIDGEDANPVRELRQIDADAVKDLTSKLIVRKAKPKPAAAAKPSTAKAKAKAAPAPAPAPDPAPPVTDTPTPPAPVTPEEPTTDSAIPTEMSQINAWNFVCEHKGDTGDTDVQGAWMAATREVADGRQEKELTEADWAKVCKIVVSDLALEV